MNTDLVEEGQETLVPLRPADPVELSERIRRWALL
jgi:hypothetical protein